MLRTWDLKFKLDRVPNGQSLHLQIAEKIIEEIENGRLKPLAVMPGTRELAESLNVNRKTVVLTYGELIAQGWLVTENRRGTFVPEHLPIYPGKNKSNEPKLLDMNIAIKLDENPHKVINTRTSNYLNLADGLTDVRLVPYELLSRSYRRALVSSTRNNSMSSVDPRGSVDLRKSIAEMLTMERGLHITPDNVCVVNGSQMGLFIAARVTTKPQECIVLEGLTYRNAHETFKSCGASLISVGIDEYGIKVDEIEKLCNSHLIKAVYVTPQHQFPTTVTLSAARRVKLLKLANQYNFMIIEDDHDNEYHFSNTPTFPIASEDEIGKVLYIGSLTSLLSPGFNIAYLVGSESVIQSCAHELSIIDCHRSSAQQISISELMKSGDIKRHMRKMTKIYRERRDTFKSLLQEELDEWLTFTIPEGGLAFWLQFKSYIHINELIIKAHAQGLFLDIEAYTANDLSLQAIRVGFAALNDSEIKEVIKRLKEAIKYVLNIKKSA